MTNPTNKRQLLGVVFALIAICAVGLGSTSFQARKGQLRLNAAVSNAMTVCFVCKSATKTVFVSEACERLTGWTQAEIEQQGLEVLIPPGLHDSHETGIRRILAGEYPGERNWHARLIEFIHRDGSRRPALLKMAAVQYDGVTEAHAYLLPLDQPEFELSAVLKEHHP